MSEIKNGKSEIRTWLEGDVEWVREGTYASQSESDAVAAALKTKGYKTEVSEVPDEWKLDLYWKNAKKYVVYRSSLNVSLESLTAQQKGRCGELLVQLMLLKHGIESAPLTTDTGIDLVAYPRTINNAWPLDRPATIQVKASTHRGSSSDKFIEWDVPENCPADFVALVDLDRNKLWLLPISDFRNLSSKAGKEMRRLWWSPPGYEYQKQHRRENDFADYEMDYGILNAFKKVKVTGPNAKQISGHDGTSGLIDALQQKTKGNPAVDVRLDI